ncbi:unnamed protein product, partial [Ectocarpus sp. 8 AP-2014]
RRRNAPPQRQEEEARIDGRRPRKSGCFLPPPSCCCCCCCGVVVCCTRGFSLIHIGRRVIVLRGAACLSLLPSCCRDNHTCESYPAASCLSACIDLVGACWEGRAACVSEASTKKLIATHVYSASHFETDAHTALEVIC